MKSWIFRDTLLTESHRWPLIVLHFLIGSLLGLAVAIVWPSPHQATLEISVELNPYRVVDDLSVAKYAGVQFRNVDDYKYWQMQQLNSLVLFDEYLHETLVRLRGIDPYWNSVSVEELRGMLQVYWRNAGKWLLVAGASQPDYAEQAVSTWRDVIFDKTINAISNAKHLLLLDLQLQTITDEQLALRMRATELAEIKDALLTWQESLEVVHYSGSIETIDSWRFGILAARAAGMDLGWKSLLEDIPPPGASPQEYGSWIDRLIPAIEEEAEIASTQLDHLELERSNVFTQWENALQEGHGLSATLFIEQPSDLSPHVKQVRSTGLVALVGGLLGLLIWGLEVLFRVSLGGAT